MTDRPSIAPPFAIGAVTFTCWIVDDGQRYVWRSQCGRYTAGRIGRHFWARRDGKVVGAKFHSLKFAMTAAVHAAQSEAA